MAKKFVDFGMFWQCYGNQSIELPNDINAEDEEAVKAYVESQWDDIPLPSGEYVSGSDEPDFEIMQIYTVE